MGRQAKKGLDYFSFYTDLLTDPKLRMPRQKYGYLAQMVYVSLLCLLYRDKGYYIPYMGEKRNDTIWQICDMLQGRYTVTPETVSSVIGDLTACELFSGDLYRRDIITSKRAQEVFYRATIDRKHSDINFDIWLLSEEEMRNISVRSPILKAFISRPINAISRPNKNLSTDNQPINAISQPINEIVRPINAISRSINPQSTVQKSKVQESKVQYSTVQQNGEPSGISADELAGALEEIIDDKIDRNFRLDIERLQEYGMQYEVFLDAARQASKKTISKPAAYLRTILRGYERDGILTAADIDATQGKNDIRQNTAVRHNPQIETWEQDWLERVREHARKEKDNDG